MRVERLVNQYIEAELAKKYSKIIVIYGARQVGKTTLVEDILKNYDKRILRINGDRLSDTIPFSSRDIKILESAIAGYDILFIDEAQRIPEIGINLKIL